MYNYNNYPYRRIPVRRANRRNGAGASVQPNQKNETADMPNQTAGTLEPEIPQTAATNGASDGTARPKRDDQDPKTLTSEPDWKALATSQQADMDNFRKRQARRADEAIAAERDRLLRQTLNLADNLERALSQDLGEDGALRQGVELTYRELVRQLEAEGVTRLEAVGQAFDPNIHEALATVPSPDAEPNTVFEEIEAGYMLADKLLRPARVVVVA